MAIYSLGIRPLSILIDEPAIEYRTTAANRPRLLELSYQEVVAISSTIGLGRPDAIGVTPTPGFIYSFLKDDLSEPDSQVTAVTAWTTKPTVPTQFIRRAHLVSLIGVGIIWTFPRGLVIQPASSVVLWNIIGNQVADVNCVVDA